jgi:hypothetical protein
LGWSACYLSPQNVDEIQRTLKTSTKSSAQIAHSTSHRFWSGITGCGAGARRAPTLAHPPRRPGCSTGSAICGGCARALAHPLQIAHPGAPDFVALATAPPLGHPDPSAQGQWGEHGRADNRRSLPFPWTAGCQNPACLLPAGHAAWAMRSRPYEIGRVSHVPLRTGDYCHAKAFSPSMRIFQHAIIHILPRAQRSGSTHRSGVIHKSSVSHRSDWLLTCLPSLTGPACQVLPLRQSRHFRY